MLFSVLSIDVIAYRASPVDLDNDALSALSIAQPLTLFASVAFSVCCDSTSMNHLPSAALSKSHFLSISIVCIHPWILYWACVSLYRLCFDLTCTLSYHVELRQSEEAACAFQACSCDTHLVGGRPHACRSRLHVWSVALHCVALLSCLQQPSHGLRCP